MIARAARAARQRVDGVLLLDKPSGLTSQNVVSRVKTLFSAAKAGHTGTLDPMATGLLPIALGEATKFSGALLAAGKTYVATLRLGETTTTGDLEGDITSTSAVSASRPEIDAALRQFRGEILQTPPMYSALKRAGKPLYEYARRGVEVPREPRRVTIDRLEVVDFTGRELHIDVACSKGTYIRVLAEDIGRALGCGACLSALRRTRVGPLDVSESTTLEALAALPAAERFAQLRPVDMLLAELPLLELDEEEARRISTGVALEGVAAPRPGLVRIYGPGNAFLGVAEAAIPGRLEPRRLVASGVKP